MKVDIRLPKTRTDKKTWISLRIIKLIRRKRSYLLCSLMISVTQLRTRNLIMLMKLYVFCKQYELDYWGELEIVEIYIKVNMIEMRNGDPRAFIVSFHKRNFEIAYLFR